MKSYIGAMYIVAWDGYIAQPGFPHLSLAIITESSIDSLSNQYPIHSDTIISTFSGNTYTMERHHNPSEV